MKLAILTNQQRFKDDEYDKSPILNEAKLEWFDIASVPMLRY